MSDQISKFCNYVNNHDDDFVRRLADAVQYPSIGSDETQEGRQYVIDMGGWLHAQLAHFVAKPEDAQVVNLGFQDDTDPNLGLPPLILGRIGEDLPYRLSCLCRRTITG
ncbi:hypothetical protein PAXINDRAFT_18934 [Paxillus involutus ATCC 200175]|uniref:Uncharacterized protein n=1 Tax=Paxillus involutus ATCC 200175 TaxID=664439 RepID=A0A0C9T9X8_PAXIN|nr:hypothetical protein PAXINDRAFT_18934 [Paxillus involutus ATCC 200175]